MNGNHWKFRYKIKKPCEVDGFTLHQHNLLNKIIPSHNRSQDNRPKHIPNTHSSDSNQSVFTLREPEKNVLLRMKPVTLHRPNGVVEMLTPYDEAFTVTLVEESVAENLGINEDLCGISRVEYSTWIF